MPDGRLLGAHMNGGVMIREPGYDSDWKRAREEVFTLVAGADQQKSFWSFLRKQVGKPYDMTAIAGIAFGREWQKADSWYCSELIAAALAACGWFPFPLASDIAKITPRDLLLLISARQFVQL
jgi:uncharacterized protein YycO